MPIARQRFTIAHELGHILLHHFNSNLSNEYIEKEANMFAIRLLAPTCIIKELNINTVDQLAKTFNISAEAANYRLKRMQILNKRNKFYTNDLEIQLINQFKNIIRKN